MKADRNAFTTCEWDVVCGYDDAQHLLLGRGSYAGWEEYAAADQARAITCTAICPALGAILIGDKRGEYDARTAEMAALREAVAHARSTVSQDRLRGGEWVMLDGLQCYDRWVQDFRSDPPKAAGMGDRYCFGVYQSTHRAASEFMRELAPRYPEAAECFLRAAEHLGGEASALHECAEMLFPGWQLPTEADRGANDRAADLLNAARDSYARAIEEIDAGLQCIDG